MHIWYIHHYGGGPGLGSYDRPFQLARAWQQDGHTATVFVARRHHLLEQGVSPESEFEIGGVRYVSIPTKPYANNGLLRMANIWDFTRRLYSVGKRYAAGSTRPDAIIASSPHPFTILPAHSLARLCGAKLVFEMRDIWPLSITEILGISRLHPFVQLCAAAERFALSRSDLIASVLPRGDRYLADRGYRGKQYVFVPNGVGLQTESEADATLKDETVRAVEKVRNWRAEGLATVVYAGSIGRPNAVDLLLEAAAIGASEEKKARCALLIVGVGDQFESLQGFSKSKGLPDVHFAGALPKTDVVKLLLDADIGYAGLRNIERLFKYGISPNKIADYHQAGLPVFLPIAPCGDSVSESGGGIAMKAETPEAVWAALRKLICLAPEERRVLGDKGRAFVAREYDYVKIARRYADAIARL